MDRLNLLMILVCFWLVQIQVHVSCSPIPIKSLPNKQNLALKDVMDDSMSKFVKRGKTMDGIKKFFGMGKKNTSKNTSSAGSSHGSTKPPPSKQSSSNHLSKAPSKQLSHSNSFSNDAIPGEEYQRRPDYKLNKNRGRVAPPDAHEQWNQLPSGGSKKSSGVVGDLFTAAASAATFGFLGHSSSNYVAYGGGAYAEGNLTGLTSKE